MSWCGVRCDVDAKNDYRERKIYRKALCNICIRIVRPRRVYIFVCIHIIFGKETIALGRTPDACLVCVCNCVQVAELRMRG